MRADVCMILEGTYPYVMGGVSTWVHNLVRSLPSIRFALVTILPARSTYKEYRYDIPENIVSMSEVYIHEHELSAQKNRGRKESAYKALADFHGRMKNGDFSLPGDVYRLAMSSDDRIVSPAQMLQDESSWNMLMRAYEEMKDDESFIDYFWTWRFSHIPLLRVADAAIPEAAVYHTVSTGYAGFLAALAKVRTGAPMVLTEHGIYTNERRIEIEQSGWIYEKKNEEPVILPGTGRFKQIWTRMFDALGRMCYNHADEIITLYENNRKVQILGGAPPEKTRVIPNGIRMSEFSAAGRAERDGGPYQVGFVGRVVSIKDVKTFLRACHIVSRRFPDTHFPIMGPTDEEPDYFAECLDMVKSLGLEGKVEFTGRVDVRKKYPELDVLVLTSVSEAQPLVLLEANLCGVPCVASDVGACRELLFGRTQEDAALGPGGLITPIASPEATAAAIIHLLSEDSLRTEMGASGAKRVQRFYNEKDLNFAYYEIYTKYMARRKPHSAQGED